MLEDRWPVVDSIVGCDFVDFVGEQRWREGRIAQKEDRPILCGSLRVIVYHAAHADPAVAIGFAQTRQPIWVRDKLRRRQCDALPASAKNSLTPQIRH